MVSFLGTDFVIPSTPALFDISTPSSTFSDLDLPGLFPSILNEA
jgi:hypothetical protein